MAKIIEFYVPTGFQRKEASQPGSQEAKIIEFCAITKVGVTAIRIWSGCDCFEIESGALTSAE